jgi:hypothetical protein
MLNLQALQRVEDTNDIRAMWELSLLLTYYESSFDRIRKTNMDVKVCIAFCHEVSVFRVLVLFEGVFRGKVITASKLAVFYTATLFI